MARFITRAGAAAASDHAFQARFVHTWALRDGRVMRMEGVADTAVIVLAVHASSA